MLDKNHNLPTPLNQPHRSDAAACRRVLANQESVEDAIGCLSTSETIAVALAFGRADLLPAPYTDFRLAWRRLDRRQRSLVDHAAMAEWHGQEEGGPC